MSRGGHRLLLHRLDGPHRRRRTRNASSDSSSPSDATADRMATGRPLDVITMSGSVAN